MQHMWYEVHAGEAHLAAKQYGPALKKFLAVQSHFVDIGEDQFDFHSYCIRKMTLRSYVAMLRMEDHLYDHPMFLRVRLGLGLGYICGVCM
jgi:peptide alpha-N-acetyltransferase